MPVPGGAEPQVAAWLAALDGADPEALQSEFTQKTLRRWRSDNPGHRSFTVLRHPATRAHHAFCKRILNSGPGSFPKIRKTLCQLYQMPLPKSGIPEGYDAAQHRAAFLVFLDFVQDNIQGQTSQRIDPNWVSQSEILKGFASVGQPDFVLREWDLPQMLPILAGQVGYLDPPAMLPPVADGPITLEQIYDAEIEAKLRAVYSRDYLKFGFAPWADQAA
tara:strand:- start:223 stop:879 length:657 start_codon:yes stop_codon:yes gene_type:complete